MKEFIKIIIVLTSTCIICAFLLSFIHSIAKSKIELNARKKIEDAILELAPSKKRMDEVKLTKGSLYKLFDNKDGLFGYAFIAEGNGYQGKIKILAVIEPSLGKLSGIEIIESVETPGLGSKIKEESFKSQFKGINVSGIIECIKAEVKKDNQIKAITSATVSSKSVVNILNKRLEEIKQELSEE